MNADRLNLELDRLSDPERALVLSKFFKTGKGEYGEGDKFLGVTVPEQRKVAKKYKDLGIVHVQELLSSKIHEHRLMALLILIERYKASNNAGKKKIFRLYLRNIKNINNWDLVDLSAPNIVGDYLLGKNKSELYRLAESKNLWAKRISIISTFNFIKNGDLKHTLKIAESLLRDKHDLIQKAVGWMLREVGKKDQEAEELFLKENIAGMPRTTLRYAIEKFRDDKKKYYMNLGKSKRLDQIAPK